MPTPPKHYGSTMLMDYLISHNIGFAAGNICKYVVRYQEKDGIKDLHKARVYLDALIAHEELQPIQQFTLPVQGDLFKDQQS